MNHCASSDPRPDRAPRLLERIDKMSRAGRITDEDAARLGAAAEAGEIDEFDEAVRNIRLEHVRARVTVAVEEGRLTREEADVVLGRVEDGEDPRPLLRRLGRRARPQLA